MEQAIKVLRILQGAMLATIVLYAAVGEAVGSKSEANSTVFYAMTLVAVSMVGVILVVRRTLVLPAAESLRAQPENPANLNRWRVGYIITYALAEAIALFGFVLRFSGFSFSQIAAFYLAGFVMILFFSPKIVSAGAA